jgi:hypothetical protein
MKRVKRKPMSRTFTAIAGLAALIALSASAATTDENPYSDLAPTNMPDQAKGRGGKSTAPLLPLSYYFVRHVRIVDQIERKFDDQSWRRFHNLRCTSHPAAWRTQLSGTSLPVASTVARIGP